MKNHDEEENKTSDGQEFEINTFNCKSKQTNHNVSFPVFSSENEKGIQHKTPPCVTANNNHTNPHEAETNDFADHPHLTPMMLINEISKLFRDRIRDENMQNSYRMLLFHLAIRGGRTQLELANMTHLKPPTISVTLQKMEFDGFVKRVANEKDMRQTLVYLTEKGEEYYKNIRKRIDIIDRNISSGFSAEEQQALVSMLLRIRSNIKQPDDNRAVPPKTI